MVTQCGGRLACAPPFPLEQGVEIARDSPLHHRIDGPGSFMGHDRQGLALPVCVLEARQIFLAPRIGVEQQDCRFGKSPCERGVTDVPPTN